MTPQYADETLADDHDMLSQPKIRHVRDTNEMNRGCPVHDESQ